MMNAYSLDIPLDIHNVNQDKYVYLYREHGNNGMTPLKTTNIYIKQYQPFKINKLMYKICFFHEIKY